MPEVRVTVATQQFNPAHAEAFVRPLYNIGLLEFRVKAGPAAAGVELAAGIEQGLAAAHTVIMSTVPALLVFTCERRFGSSLPGDAVLFRCKLLFPFLLGLVNFRHAGIVPNLNLVANRMLKSVSQARKLKPVLWVLPALLVVLPFIQLGGCAAPTYYSQAISGHLGLMNKRENIDTILEKDSTDPELARELELSIEIRKFAVTQLYLPDNDSYTQFVSTGQNAVTWNVVAAPEFSLKPRQWCFMVSGCVPYRGYFKIESAEKFAQKLMQDGFDTSVSPAIAYSTLGWFDDPLLDTMFQYSDEQLAAFIFHELAHQQLYVKGDTAFNEAYASFVEETGVRLWLENTGRAEQLPGWLKLEQATLQFNALLQDSVTKLNTLYSSGLPDKQMRDRKSAAFSDLRDAYRVLVDTQWDGRSYFESLLSRKLNNASLALINSYQGGACAFEKLFAAAAGDMARFHQLATEKAALESERRSSWLNQPCAVIASNSDL
jgi:predicted aminopeptidase